MHVLDTELMHVFGLSPCIHICIYAYECVLVSVCNLLEVRAVLTNPVSADYGCMRVGQSAWRAAISEPISS